MGWDAAIAAAINPEIVAATNPNVIAARYSMAATVARVAAMRAAINRGTAAANLEVQSPAPTGERACWIDGVRAHPVAAAINAVAQAAPSSSEANLTVATTAAAKRAIAVAAKRAETASVMDGMAAVRPAGWVRAEYLVAWLNRVVMIAAMAGGLLALVALSAIISPAAAAMAAEWAGTFAPNAGLVSADSLPVAAAMAVASADTFAHTVEPGAWRGFAVMARQVILTVA